MLEGLLALPIFIPVLFWAGYHYHKDRHLPEPPQNLALCFFLGIAAALLSRLLYSGLETVGWRMDAVALADTDQVALFVYALLVIGPVEELSKIVPFVLVALRFRAFDDDMDGIIYASFIALGYAAVENVHYLQFLTPTEALARGFAGPFIHIAFASIWGHAIGRAHLSGRSLLLPGALSLGLSAGLHGIYDFFALSGQQTSMFLASVLVVAIWVWRLAVIRRIHRRAGTTDCGD
jgi:RsiW-degrading membrane proteinase PrsW (M82 family)